MPLLITSLSLLKSKNAVVNYFIEFIEEVNAVVNYFIEFIEDEK